MTDAAKIEAEDPAPRDRPFDPWRSPKSNRARAAVAEVLTQLQNYESHFLLRSRRRRPADQDVFERSVAAVVCDLMHRELTEPGGRLAVPLSNQVLGRRGRYSSPVLSKVLPQLLKRMESPEMAWLNIVKGRPGHFGTGRQTTIGAAPRLLRRITDYKIGLDDLGRADGGEVIILKAPKANMWDDGEWIDYEDTPQTKGYREEVRRVNAWLEQADIDIDEAVAPQADPTDRHMRRYFNNASFEQGGRLFGGFWQNLTKEERREGFQIDGEPVVALDFGQIAPRILYAMVGATPPEGDIYTVPGLERHREGVKKLLNAALNVTSPLQRYPKWTRRLFPSKYPVREVMRLIESRHRGIAHLFYTGVGLKEMFKESEILIDALLALISRRVTALPIHDALIAPRSKVELVREVMLSTFRGHTGIDGVVTIEGE